MPDVTSIIAELKPYAELMGAAVGAAVAAYVIHRGRQAGKGKDTDIDDVHAGTLGERLARIERKLDTLIARQGPEG